MSELNRFGELLSRHLDAALTRDEEAELLELLQDADRRGYFVELMRLDREIAGILAAPIPDDAMVALVRKDIEESLKESARQPGVCIPALLGQTAPRAGWRKLMASRRARWLGALAASILLVSAVLLTGLFRGDGASSVAVVKRVQGTVHVVTAAGRVPAEAGRTLRPGQELVTVGDGSNALVEFPDATRLELAADTSLSPMDSKQSLAKKLFLDRGVLSVEAAEQQSGQSLVVETPHATVDVVGTSFTLESGSDATVVEVSKGAVQFTRNLDHQSIEVKSGTFAVASPRLEKFASQPMSADAGGTGRTINVAKGAKLAHKGGVAALAFAPDGSLLASAVWSDGKVKVWPMRGATASEPTDLAGHTNAVWALAFSRDSKLLASGGVDKFVRIWDADKRKEIASFQQDGDVRALAFAPDGSVLASAGFDSTLRLGDPRSGALRRKFPENDKGGWAGVYALAFTPDSLSLALGLSDRRLRLRDVAGAVRYTHTDHTDAIRSVAFSPDGTLLASASNNEVIVREVRTGVLRYRMSASAPVAFSSDGRLLATGGAAPTLWLAGDGREWGRLQGHRGDVYALAFAPAGKQLALGGWLGITLVDLPEEK